MTSWKEKEKGVEQTAVVIFMTPYDNKRKGEEGQLREQML